MRFLALPLFILLVCGCASTQQNTYFPSPKDYVPFDQIRIKAKFDSVLLTKENLVIEQQKCVSFLQANTISMRDAVNKFPRNNTIVVVGHQSSSKKFIYKDTTGLCMDFSESKYPIYAVETFIGTANPTGVPPDITDDWYAKIAMLIAVKGQAKVLYITDKGTAFLVSYWSDPVVGYILNYSSEFKKIGEWENAQVDYKFSDPNIKGISVINRGTTKEMVKRFPLAQN